MQVKIINKIPIKIEEYQRKHGTTLTWIARQFGESRQQINRLMKTDRLYIHHLVKFAIILNCKIEDLYDYVIVSDE